MVSNERSCIPCKKVLKRVSLHMSYLLVLLVEANILCIREREKEGRKGAGGREGRTQGFTIAEE